MGFLEIRFAVGGKITPLFKTCKNYARNLKFCTYVHTRISFQKIYLLVPPPLNFADINTFYAETQHFSSKIVPLLTAIV